MGSILFGVYIGNVFYIDVLLNFEWNIGKCNWEVVVVVVDIFYEVMVVLILVLCYYGVCVVDFDRIYFFCVFV